MNLRFRPPESDSDFGSTLARYADELDAAIVALRESLLALPAQLAPRLAAESDPAKVEAILRAALGEHLPEDPPTEAPAS